MNGTLSAFRKSIPDDGLPVTAAEPWFRQKIKLLQAYVSAFVATMSGRVQAIVFVDLYAGNGLFSMGAGRECFSGSGISILQMDLPINKYVLCERDEAQARVLKVRVNKYFRDQNVALITGKSDEILEKLKLYVPVSKRGYKVAVFCWCDPFSLESGYKAISQLCESGFTVMMPFTFPLGRMMDYRYYMKEERLKVGKFFEDYGEVKLIEKDLTSNHQFYKRIVNRLNNKMLSLGMNTTLTMHKLDSGLMELPFYCVGLFSDQLSTDALQRDAMAGMNLQFELFN